MADKTGRNAPCPCGSGKKYKHCCGKEPMEPVTMVPAPEHHDNVKAGQGNVLPGFYVARAEVDGERLTELFRQHDRFMAMPGSRFNKFLARVPAEGWGSIFVDTGNVLVMADNPHLGQRIQEMVGAVWQQPLTWGQPGPQMDFIAIAEEMMVDKFIEKWLSSPDPALNNLTPWQAVKVKPLRGRLSRLIEEWEKDMQGKLDGLGYVYPFAWLRDRLGLGDNEISEVTAEEVETFRSAALIKDDIADYSWLADDYAQAVLMADMLLRDEGWQDRKHRAFILYLWNEFTTLQQPEIEGVKEWAVVIKLLARYYPQTVPPEAIEEASEFAEADPEIIDAYLDRVFAYYRRYPLNREDLSYFIDSEWDNLDIQEQIKIYKDLMEAMMELVRVSDHEKHYEQSLENFLQSSFTADSDELANLFGELFTQWYLMDARLNADDLSVAQMFEELVRDLGPAERVALDNLLASYISIYKVVEVEGPDCRVRDLIMKKTYPVMVLRRDPMCRGDFFLARLVPVEGSMVPLSGWIPLSSVMGAQLIKIADRLARESGHDQSANPVFLKSNGIALVAAFSYVLREQARQFGQM